MGIMGIMESRRKGIMKRGGCTGCAWRWRLRACVCCLGKKGPQCKKNRTCRETRKHISQRIIVHTSTAAACWESQLSLCAPLSLSALFFGGAGTGGLFEGLLLGSRCPHRRPAHRPRGPLLGSS